MQPSAPVLHVSPIFHVHAHLDDGYPPDISLQSTDGVLFHVHSHILRRNSNNDFGHLLSASTVQILSPISPAQAYDGGDSHILSGDPFASVNDYPGSADLDTILASMINMDEHHVAANPDALMSQAPLSYSPGGQRFDEGAMPAIASHASRHTFVAAPIMVHHRTPIISLILLSAYSMDIPPDMADWTVLSEAVTALATQYGFAPSTHLSTASPLFRALLLHASVRPQEVYALAAEYAGEDLAVAASAYLLSLQVDMISDEWAQRVGVSYLNRLLTLLDTRVEALRQIVQTPPQLHPPTQRCDVRDQNGKMMSEWAQGVAQVVVHARYAVAGSDVLRLTPDSIDQIRLHRWWMLSCRPL